jgi:hypothetical protein
LSIWEPVFGLISLLRRWGLALCLLEIKVAAILNPSFDWRGFLYPESQIAQMNKTGAPPPCKLGASASGSKNLIESGTSSSRVIPF